MFIFGHQCRCRCQCQCWNADAKISKWPPQTKPCIVYCNRLSTVKIPAGIYLLKVNNRNTRTRCEICSKLTIKSPKRRQSDRSGIFNVNFERTSYLLLVFLLLTLNMYLPTGLYFPKPSGQSAVLHKNELFSNWFKTSNKSSPQANNGTMRLTSQLAWTYRNLKQ